jgi:DNA-binding transcriptional MocR family regulator
MHLAVVIQGLRNDQKIATKAGHQSLWLSALSQLYIGKICRQGFVLGFGNTRLAQIVPAVRQLKTLLNRKGEHLKL